MKVTGLEVSVNVNVNVEVATSNIRAQPHPMSSLSTGPPFTSNLRHVDERRYEARGGSTGETRMFPSQWTLSGCVNLWRSAKFATWRNARVSQLEVRGAILHGWTMLCVKRRRRREEECV